MQYFFLDFNTVYRESLLVLNILAISVVVLSFFMNNMYIKLCKPLLLMKKVVVNFLVE